MNAMFTPFADEPETEHDLAADGAPEEGQTPEDEGELDISGGEPADTEDEGTSKPEPFMVVTVDGQDSVIASKEEAIPLVRQGLHYTREMQKLREAERQFTTQAEQMTQGLRQKESQYAAALQTLSATYGYVLG